MGGTLDPALHHVKSSSVFGAISIPLAIVAASGDFVAEEVMPNVIEEQDAGLALATVSSMAFWLNALVASLVFAFLGLSADRKRGFAVAGLAISCVALVLLAQGLRCLGCLLLR